MAPSPIARPDPSIAPTAKITFIHAPLSSGRASAAKTTGEDTKSAPDAVSSIDTHFTDFLNISFSFPF
jgi:hypothetical protein